MSNESKHIQGEATGHNGTIQYEVDVTNNKIEDLKILKHSETSGIFNQVIDKLKKDVIEQQSFDVDAISGATVMTNAILDSAKQAVAAEDVTLTPIPKKQNVHQTTRLRADVVIIGGGEAGLIAGCRALTMGQKVILVEKNGYLGGATILNGSNVVATGSKVAAAAFGDNGDSPERLAADVARECRQTNLTDMTTLMAHNIGPAIDFISDFAGLDYMKAQTQTPEHSVERQVELPSASSYEFITKVSKAFEDHGGKILLGAKVAQLTFSLAGEVNGLVAEAQDETIKIKAHSIVLASGGYGANTEMRGAESKGIDYYGPMTSTGDAYRFNADLKLKTHDLDWYKVYPHGVETEPGIAKLTTYASKQATDMGAIYVNRQGKRIVNESDVYTKFRDAILAQPDKIAYLVMDERTWQAFYDLLVLHDFTAKEIEGFFANQDKQPLFAKGSLAEVAAQAGVDVAGLQQTVATYEAAVKTGQDTEFGRDAKFLHDFEGETYYMVEQRGRFATTLGGFSIDTKTMQLIDHQDQDVRNYFAAGEVAGGANGHDAMPSMMNSWGISSGYVAGAHASENADAAKQNGANDLNLVAIVGTNASKSYNRQLLHAMRDLFEAQANIDICEIKDLPLFNEDLVNDVPTSVQTLSDKVEDADGVIFAVPEYDHAIPAALKSAIEWLSCATHPFKDKPVMIVGTSLGIQGTVRAQMNLRQILDAPGVDARVLAGNEFMLPQGGAKFDENNHITDPGSVNFLKQCFSNFTDFVQHDARELVK
ncbi:FAD-dependent oxidoreductase [Loigolactobacillus bifermentans]|nr:FAD-dependent oxidoreductase [Loigolactobacillus bifermentans]QGG61613.1 FAD-dependent oxidoreductase [Loigolactobacillus bifermentans]